MASRVFHISEECMRLQAEGLRLRSEARENGTRKADGTLVPDPSLGRKAAEVERRYHDMAYREEQEFIRRGPLWNDGKWV